MKTTIVKLTNRSIIIPGLFIFILFSIYMLFVEYPQTGYPADIIRAQLTFSAPELKSHFNELIQSGNLHRYQNYHLIDFPFVCTGWPEYLFEPTGEYFMADTTPRIATVRELEQFFRSIDKVKLKKLLSDPWVVLISNG